MTAVGAATSVREPSNGQRLFLGYTLFILVDLAVLNFFFVMLEAIDVVFGDRVEFGGVIPFIAVVIAIIVTEATLSKIYAMLSDEPISH